MGLTLLVVGLVWLLALTDTIVMPVITAAVVAAVASPVIAWLQRRGLPRGLAAALMMVAAIALGIGMVLLIVGGITNETSGLSGQLNDAKNTIEGWLKDLGIDPSTAKNAKDSASSSSTAAVGTLLNGVVQGLEDAVLPGLLPRPDRAEPVLPAQGRAPDPRSGGNGTWECP